MEAEELLARQRTYFKSQATKSINFRIHQLQTLRRALQEYEEALTEAVSKDFKKPEFETFASEIGLLYQEISFTLKHLKKWAKPKRVKGDLINFPSRNYVYKEPYGAVLIIGPWNYPIQLILMPLIGAIAAGNTVVLKPSEISSHTAEAIRQMISKWFKEEFVAVVNGGVEVTQDLLSQPFDYLFFTGSPRVGKIVMKAAAENLTPVTLELGGKSPCIVDETVNLKTAARRIAWGKYFNAGQTCVAPDYLMIHESVEQKFLEYFRESVKEFYGEQAEESRDYAHIINESHFDRLTGYLKEGEVVMGGNYDRSSCFMEPSVLRNIKEGAKVMEEEIFGPVLPVLTYQNPSEAIDFILEKPKPLALYVFTNKEETGQLFLEKCSFGGGALNDVVAHFASHHMPMGGVGNSGMGAYHGKHSFETFSHSKSILKKPIWPDIPLRYAPYNGKLKWLKRILK